MAYGVLGQLVPGEGIPADAMAAAAVLVERARDCGPGRALVVVDDAHWADTPSLQALSSAVRHHHDAALLLVTAATTGVGDAPSETLELLRRGATAEVFTSAPLGPGAVTELAAAHGVSLHPFVAEQDFTRHTGGLPRHVVQLLAELPRALWTAFDPDLPAPAEVAAGVLQALAGCSVEGRRLARAVAVLGAGQQILDAALLAGTADVLAALDEVTAAGLVSFGVHGFTEVGPADPMVRAALLAGMGPAAVAEAHRGAADLVDDPVRRLGHLVAATPTPDADLADRLDALADERAGEGAWGAAAKLLADASRLTDDRLLRESRLARAMDALVGAGDGLGATALVPEVEGLRETPMRNAVLGYLAIVRGRASEAETRLRRAWDLVNVEREPEVAALICQRYVLHSLSRCRSEELVGWADRAIHLVGPESPAALESAAIRGLGLAGAGHPDEALSGYRDLGDTVRNGAQAQRVMMGRGWLELMVDRVDDARADLESAVPTTVLGGSTRISLWARAWLARAQFVTGDWDLALRTVEDGAELSDRSGMVLASPLLHWTAAQVHALRGDWDLAEQSLRRADAGPRDYEIMRVPACLARAQVAEARADYGAVVRELTPLTQPWAGGSIDEPGAWPWPDVYANALVIEGRYGEADAFLVPHEERARQRDRRSARARLGYARGRLLGAQGDLPAARSAFERSLALLEDLPLRYDRARVGYAYGQTLRRAGKRREADAVLSAAREIYLALGATTYVTRCDRELKAGGLHAVRTAGGLGELTPQEQAVSQLVARGLSNREVAAELFVSTKTVQYHLTRIYTKLGVRSRSELAALRRPALGADPR